MQTDDKNKSAQTKVDPNKEPAAEQAQQDIDSDPDMQPDTSETADLDEGELARADNSND